MQGSAKQPKQERKEELAASINDTYSKNTRRKLMLLLQDPGRLSTSNGRRLRKVDALNSLDIYEAALSNHSAARWSKTRSRTLKLSNDGVTSTIFSVCQIAFARNHDDISSSSSSESESSVRNYMRNSAGNVARLPSCLYSL